MALIFCDQEEKAKSLTEIPVLRRLSHRANANSLTPPGFLLSKKSKPLLVSPVPCSVQATLPNTVSNIKEYSRNHQDKNNTTEKCTKARTGNLEEKRNK